MEVIIYKFKINKKTDVCKAYGFESNKTHIWRAKLREIRLKEQNDRLFKGLYLSPLEMEFLIKYIGKPTNLIE